jgi:hypothetical protein
MLFVKKMLIKLLCRSVFIPELFMTNVRMTKPDYRRSMTSRSSDFEKIQEFFRELLSLQIADMKLKN